MALESEGERSKLFTRRAFLLAGGQGVLFTTLMGRMYYLGVVESGEYKTLAEENRVSLRVLAPDRGEILDRKGEKIATNRKDYRVFVIPEQAGDMAETLKALGNIIKISERDEKRILRRVRRQRAFFPVTVAENLNWDDFARINVELPDLPGVQPDAGQTRYYPDGHIAAHVAGYVGPVSDRDLDEDPVLQLPGFKIGRSGLEKSFEKELRGRAGSSRVEVNAYGREIRELDRQPGGKGDSLVLTIDLELQKFATKRLGEESASVVVMDVWNGDILAKVSSPSFDANDFNLGFSQENWNALMKDPRHPLVNKCLSGQYPPASTFKMAVALAALEEGVVDKHEKVHCSGRHKYGNRYFHCWKPNGHGRVNMTESLAHSCDVYFYIIAERLGIDRISAMARKLGLGEAYGLGIASEASGLVPTREWKMGTLGEPWHRGETLNVGIGQGALLATPLQLAVMTSRIANGGYAVKPRIVHAVGDRVIPYDVAERMPFSAENIKIVQQGMIDVLRRGGTAYGSRLPSKTGGMAGKTGTAQVRRITQAERTEGLEKLKKRPWKERDHALFVSYAPIENPRYALSVVVEHGGGGSAVAAPIARDVMKKVLELDPLKTPPILPGVNNPGSAD